MLLCQAKYGTQGIKLGPTGEKTGAQIGIQVKRNGIQIGVQIRMLNDSDMKILK